MRYLVFLSFFIPSLGFASNSTPVDQCLNTALPFDEKLAQCETAIQRIKDIEGNPASTVSLNIDLHLKIIELLTHQGKFQSANHWYDSLANIALDEFNPEQKFRFYRRKGILHYRQSEFTLALNQFLSAETVAEASNNEDWLSKALSDLGTTHSAMTHHDKALQYLQRSLLLKRKQNDSLSTAISLNNIGNVYRELKNWQQAKHFYDQAIEIYTREKKWDRIAHTQENIALVLIGLGENEVAYQRLTESYQQFKKIDNDHAQLRLLILMAELNIEQQALIEADNQLNLAQDLDLKIGKNDQSNRLKLQLGRLISLRNQFMAAESLLLTGLQAATQDSQQELQVQFLDALVNNAQRQKNWQQAFDYQIRYTNTLLSLRNQKYDASLAYHRSLLDYDEQNYQLNLLNKEKKIQSLALEQEQSKTVILILLLLIAVIMFSLFFYRWRAIRDAEINALRKEVEFHRQQFIQLGISFQSLQQAFGQIKQPILVVNNKDEIIFTNQAFYTNFQLENQFETQPLKNLIPQSNSQFWNLWKASEEIENQHINDIKMIVEAAEHNISVNISTQQREESIGIIIISTLQDTSQSIPLDSILPKASFHQLLVDLMNSSLQLWEIATQSTRIELAEQSGIWRVSIDDGRLRTRSLDRYLALKTLPKKPRWREVVRTAHFVLAECSTASDEKYLVEQRLKAVTDHLRAESLA